MSGAPSDQSIEHLNDVTAVSGVNLRVCYLVFFNLSLRFAKIHIHTSNVLTTKHLQSKQCIHNPYHNVSESPFLCIKICVSYKLMVCPRNINVVSGHLAFYH